MKLHNILQASDLALLKIQLEESKAEFLPSILYALREEGISIPFITQSIDRHGRIHLILAIAGNDLDWVQIAFQEGLDLPLKARREIALITLYGPHFGEIPGIASRILSALAAGGVKVLAMSASLNSSLLLVPQDSLAKSLHSLHGIFDIPSR